jgi:N-acetylmuramoyl-L-alanine amidase
MSRTRIVLDPGHGGTRPHGGSSPNNATGPTGLLEKALTLEAAQRTRAALATRGLASILTRTGDTNPGLVQRAGAAKAIGACVFVSIHFNGWHLPSVQGTETFWHLRGDARSARLAQAVQAALLPATGLKDRGGKQAVFGVLSPKAHAPQTAACLAEISFLTDPGEEMRLRDPAYLDRIAAALAEGVTRYLGHAAGARAVP